MKNLSLKLMGFRFDAADRKRLLWLTRRWKMNKTACVRHALNLTYHAERKGDSR